MLLIKRFILFILLITVSYDGIVLQGVNDVKQLSKIQTALMLAFLVTVWGINWPLTKAALAYSPPLLFAGIRTLIGGLLLLMVALPRFKSCVLKKRGRSILFLPF